MNKENKSGLKTYILITVFLFVIILCWYLFAWSHTIGFKLTNAHSDTAEFDLRELITQYDNCFIIGPVEYIPNALLTPQEFADREAEALLGFPEQVSRYATSRYRILLPDDDYYSLFGKSIDYSHHLYANGKLIFEIGNPGVSRETDTPNTDYLFATIKAENGIIEIVQQISNFVHREGGRHDGLWIGKNSFSGVVSRGYFDSIKLGALIALFIVNIILFILLRSYKGNLYFALFCLMWFLRAGVTGSRVFTGIFPLLSWEFKFRMEYLSIPVTAVLLINLLDILFPGILHKIFCRIMSGVSAVIAVLFIFTNTVFMSHALLWCHAVYIPAIIYILIRFALRLRRLDTEHSVFLAGVTIFLIGAINDMLYKSQYFGLYTLPPITYHIDDMTSVSMMVLGFCQAAALFIVTIRKMKKTAAENAALKENVRMTERQLAYQREQYEKFMQNEQAVKTMRHDMKHHFAVIKKLADEEEFEKIKEYSDNFTKNLTSAEDIHYCENAVVNAICVHYLELAKEAGCALDVQFDIPENTGRVPDIDLCIILGNILENALEACIRMKNGDKLIRIRSQFRQDDGTIAFVVENSFDGEYNEKGGVFISRKDESQKREGIGLSSIQTVCKKHGGFAEFEVNENVWRVSAIVKTEQ